MPDFRGVQTSRNDGWVAQLVEQRIENPRVGGSIPPPATTEYKASKGLFLLGAFLFLLWGYTGVTYLVFDGHMVIYNMRQKLFYKQTLGWFLYSQIYQEE